MPSFANHPAARYSLLGVLLLLTLHFLLSFSSSSYSTSVDTAQARLSSTFRNGVIGSGGAAAAYGVAGETWYNGKKHVGGWGESRIEKPVLREDDASTAAGGKGNGSSTVQLVNATFVVLARNSDVWEIVSSIRGMEDRFNHAYHYPWTFLNDEPFDDTFKRHTSAVASGPCSYGLVPEEHWPKGDSMPEGVDVEEAKEKIAEMGKLNIPYGGSLPYRKMCRYQSGFFWRHPLMDQYDYYWRVEPSVQYYCDIDFDPFRVMLDGGKKYGFVLSLYEYGDTIKTLWDTTKEWMKLHPEHLAEDKTMLNHFLSDNNGESYNLCHFWSNFEIGALSLWRSEAYRSYFDFLDNAGGFMRERWGDAPVHSIAAGLLLKPSELHFFREIGYFHNPFLHCPQEGVGKNCICNPKHPDAFEFHGYSCTPRWAKIEGMQKGVFGG